MNRLTPEVWARVGPWFDAGNASYLRGDFEEAAALYRQVLQHAPQHLESYNNLGAALADLGQFDAAMASYLRALQIHPDYYDAHFNLGNALKALEHPTAAAASYRRAAELQPLRPESHYCLAICLARLGALGESEASYRSALALRADYPEAWTALGLLLFEQGRFDESLACHAEALRLRPDFAEGHRNRSLVRLLLGDLPGGWADYEWRWQCADFVPLRLPQPRWQGENLPEQILMLHGEQGIGDVLQFVRYAPRVKERVGRVILATRGELIPLLRSCPGLDQLVDRDGELPAVDVHCPLMSLPLIFATAVKTIPAPIPYVYATPKQIEFWRARLGDFSGLRVGIAWQGSAGNKYYREHGISLSALAALTSVPNVQWINLQKGLSRELASEVPLPLVNLDLDASGGAFLDTAAVVSLLDLIISFDTSIAHLAGAMGRPVWIVLPRVPDWRWLLDRQDSPWYPTARLFRQTETGNWEPPLHQIVEALRSATPHFFRGTEI
jgi:tetratricopeptide (TPR) repeat protein